MLGTNEQAHSKRGGSVAIKGDARFRKALASELPAKLKISAVYCTPDLAIEVQQRFGGELTLENSVMDRWNALVRYDDQIHTAAEELRPFGDCWV